MEGLIDTRNEYMEHIQDLLCIPISKRLYSIYDECYNNKKGLKEFQNELLEIRKWNNNIVKEEYKLILKYTKCKYFENLIKIIIISTIKIKIYEYKDHFDNIKIKIPNPEDFVHKVYINCALFCWKNVYLFNKNNVRHAEYQNNLNIIEENIRRIVKKTFRDFIPFEEIFEQIETSLTENVSQFQLDDYDKNPRKNKNKDNKVNKGGMNEQNDDDDSDENDDEDDDNDSDDENDSQDDEDEEDDDEDDSDDDEDDSDNDEDDSDDKNDEDDKDDEDDENEDENDEEDKTEEHKQEDHKNDVNHDMKEKELDEDTNAKDLENDIELTYNIDNDVNDMKEYVEKEVENNQRNVIDLNSLDELKTSFELSSHNDEEHKIKVYQPQTSEIITQIPTSRNLESYVVSEVNDTNDTNDTNDLELEIDDTKSITSVTSDIKEIFIKDAKKESKKPFFF